MAAAYETGGSSSPTDLLQKLVTWLVAQGWTQNMSQSEGTGWRVHMSKSGNYVNLRATPGGETSWWNVTNNITYNTGISLYTGTGYSGASAWNAQAGGPIGNSAAFTVGVHMSLPTGAIIAYHFFDDGSDNIIIVVERSGSNFVYMGWGPSLIKAGTWTGGAYFFASTSGCYASASGNPGSWSGGNSYPPFSYADANGGACSFVRADVDTFTSKWLGAGSTSTNYMGYTGKYLVTPSYSANNIPVEIPSIRYLQGRTFNAMNSQAVLLPVYLYAMRDSSGASLLGEVPNIVISNATGWGYKPSTVYALGSDNYLNFNGFMILKKA